MKTYSKLKDIENIDLPREKLSAKGPENLKSHELLAILLRTGHRKKNVIQISLEILKKYPTEQLMNLSFEELQRIKGIGDSKAATIIAASELCKRAFKTNEGLYPVITKPMDALPLISYLKERKKEYLVAIFLNSRNQVIGSEEISIGTLNSSLVHPREIFQPAIECSSAGVIIVHNHPSGDPAPSQEDIAITKRLKKAGELLGIELLDHLIVTRNELASMKREGYFKRLES